MKMRFVGVAVLSAVMGLGSGYAIAQEDRAQKRDDSSQSSARTRHPRPSEQHYRQSRRDHRYNRYDNYRYDYYRDRHWRSCYRPYSYRQYPQPYHYCHAGYWDIDVFGIRVYIRGYCSDPYHRHYEFYNYGY